MPLLSYLFWPNPGGASYDNPKVVAIFVICGVLVLLSFTLKFWRRGLVNPVLKRLSRSWSSTCLWFGIVGIVLAVSRVEQVQFVSMRLWWLIWGLSALAYIVFQVFSFKNRYYATIPTQVSQDIRDKYLPHKKKR
ncbi:MAG: hypothetical protein PHH13_03850 [Candidatus Peribacteraceae bacterium]|nr:hypothetical protein [Candidatus Peribacteraceae bacterium]